MHYLVQSDAEENTIETSVIDLNDTESIVDKVVYYDINYQPNRDEIKNWIKSGDYKENFLSISGETPKEDDFYTDSMYLEIIEIK